MPAEPGADLGVLVSAVIIENHVDDLAGRHLALDGVKEANELLVPVALHAAADHLSVEHVERREQGGGAIALVIVRHGASPALLQRQARLGSVERLDLALLVDRQHDGMGRRIDIEPDNVVQLGGELRVGGQLELAHPMRLQSVAAPDFSLRAKPRDRCHGQVKRRLGGPRLWPCRRVRPCSILARARTIGGAAMPSAFTVFRLTTRWNFVRCWIGRLAGAAPFKLLRCRPNRGADVKPWLATAVAAAHAGAAYELGFPIRRCTAVTRSKIDTGFVSMPWRSAAPAGKPMPKPLIIRVLAPRLTA